MKERSFQFPEIKQNYTEIMSSQAIREDDVLFRYLEEIEQLFDSKKGKAQKITELKQILAKAKRANIKIFERHPQDKNKNIFHYLSLIFDFSANTNAFVEWPTISASENIERYKINDNFAADKEYVKDLIEEAISSGFDFFSRTLGKSSLPLDPLQYSIFKGSVKYAKLIMDSLISNNKNNIRGLIESLNDFYNYKKTHLEENSKQIFTVVRDFHCFLIDKAFRKMDYETQEQLIPLFSQAIDSALEIDKSIESCSCNDKKDTLILSYARYCPNIKVLELFLKKFDIEKSHHTTDKKNFLHILLGSNRPSFIEENLDLLFKQAYQKTEKMLKAIDGENNTPLVYAISSTKIDILRKIILNYPDLLYYSLNKEKDNIVILIHKIGGKEIKSKWANILGYVEQEKYEKLDKKFNEIKEENEKLRNKDFNKETFADENHSLKRKITQLEQEKSEQEKKFESENLSLQKKLKTTQENLEKIKKEHTDLLDEKQNLLSDLQKFQKETAKLKAELDQLKKEKTTSPVNLKTSLTKNNSKIYADNAITMIQEVCTQEHDDGSKRSSFSGAASFMISHENFSNNLNNELQKDEIFEKNLSSSESNSLIAENHAVSEDEMSVAKSLSFELFTDDEENESQEELKQSVHSNPHSDVVIAPTPMTGIFESKSPFIDEEENEQPENIKELSENYPPEEANQECLSNNQENVAQALNEEKMRPERELSPVVSNPFKKKIDLEFKFMPPFEEDEEPEEGEIVENNEEEPPDFGEDLPADEKKSIGKKGEEYVYRKLCHYYNEKFKSPSTRIDNPFKISGISKKGRPKEIEIIWNNQNEESYKPVDIIKNVKYLDDNTKKKQYIEVKSTKCTESKKGIAEISQKQLQCMKKYRDNFKIYRVYDVDPKKDKDFYEVTIIKDPYKNIFGEPPGFAHNIQAIKVKI